SGSGVQWWSTARDGTEAATLSRLGPDQNVGTAVLERCSRPSSGPIAPAQAPTPAAALRAIPCRGDQLTLTNDGGDAGMGHRMAIMALQNTGPQTCVLGGYPTVTLLDTRGQELTTVRAIQR